MTVATPFSSEELIAILKWLVRDKFYLTSKEGRAFKVMMLFVHGLNIFCIIQQNKLLHWKTKLFLNLF